jgi:hypothetical protein
MSTATETKSAEPIMRSKLKRKSELDSRSVEIPQKERIVLPPITEDVEREANIVVPETQLVTGEIDKLAFAEEPVTILIHRSGERFAPRCTDYIGVNGKGAEMLFKNGWVQIGYLPRGQAIVTKRKYVEVLARAKQDNVNANYTRSNESEEPVNFIDRSTISTCAFSMIEDRNPLGAEWLSQLLRQQG